MRNESRTYFKPQKEGGWRLSQSNLQTAGNNKNDECTQRQATLKRMRGASEASDVSIVMLLVNYGQQ